MFEKKSKIGRWIAAAIALGGMLVVLLQVARDNTAKGEVRKIEGYRPWSEETVKIMETLPVQDGGRIKPFTTKAGFMMLGIHGARSMKVEGADGKVHKLKPTEWMMDSIFRPQLAVHLPTFRVDNSDVLTNAGLEIRGRRDRYSYSDIEAGREKIIELAKSYESIKEAERDPVQQQTIDLAYNIRNYESLLGYMSFARSGVTLAGTATETTPDRRADVSDIMTTAPVIREKIAETQQQGLPLNPQIQNLLEQMLDAANFSKFSLFMFPPVEEKDPTWLSAGNAIMSVMTQESKDPKTSIQDVKAFETLVRNVGDDEIQFRGELTKVRDALVKRAEARGEYQRIELEADYYRVNWFLRALVFFLVATLSALAMWTVGRTKAGGICSGVTWLFTSAGLVMCIVAMVKRSVIMQRPPVGNLYDTIIFIGSTIVFLALIIEWMTKRRFALGIAPILGTMLIVLARRYELGDARDHMDPLVAVLDSNFWLMVHVITITLGYSAGLLAAFLSCGYVLMRGLNLDGGNKDLRRSFTRAVYGMICLTLFLSLVGTVLGGIWANYSWGRFWGWDPKENGALMIVLWTLAILHARMGGYIKEWGVHLSSIFTSAVVVFSWWHVNFLGVGLHNYGFTAGKGTIWVFYAVISAFMLFGFGVVWFERNLRPKIGKPSSGNLEPALGEG